MGRQRGLHRQMGTWTNFEGRVNPLKQMTIPAHCPRLNEFKHACDSGVTVGSCSPGSGCGRPRWKEGSLCNSWQQLPAKDGQAHRLMGLTAKGIATAPASLQASLKPGEGVDLLPDLLRANQPMGSLADAVILKLSISLASSLSRLKLFIRFLRNCN